MDQLPRLDTGDVKGYWQLLTIEPSDCIGPFYLHMWLLATRRMGFTVILGTPWWLVAKVRPFSNLISSCLFLFYFFLSIIYIYNYIHLHIWYTIKYNGIINSITKYCEYTQHVFLSDDTIDMLTSCTPNTSKICPAQEILSSSKKAIHTDLGRVSTHHGMPKREMDDDVIPNIGPRWRVFGWVR